MLKTVGVREAERGGGEEKGGKLTSWTDEAREQSVLCSAKKKKKEWKAGDESVV